MFDDMKISEAFLLGLALQALQPLANGVNKMDNAHIAIIVPHNIREWHEVRAKIIMNGEGFDTPYGCTMDYIRLLHTDSSAYKVEFPVIIGNEMYKICKIMNYLEVVSDFVKEMHTFIWKKIHDNNNPRGYGF